MRRNLGLEREGEVCVHFINQVNWSWVIGRYTALAVEPPPGGGVGTDEHPQTLIHFHWDYLDTGNYCSCTQVLIRFVFRLLFAAGGCGNQCRLCSPCGRIFLSCGQPSLETI